MQKNIILKSDMTLDFSLTFSKLYVSKSFHNFFLSFFPPFLKNILCKKDCLSWAVRVWLATPTCHPFSLCETDGNRRHHCHTPIRKDKCSDRTCSQRKRGDASSLLSALRICSAVLHTLFSIELAVQNRFNQLMWHCCRLAVKWKH